MDLVRQVAPTSSPVLLLGETGTGKEVVAGAVHQASRRQEGPFIKVNCGAIPQSLMDSELFGHEKGAFTGAVALKRGRFERAHSGTIFLDEIGELSPEAQVCLLRVLQEKEIERVGGSETVPVDIRVVAATHRNLSAMAKKGQFREDLYFRLGVFPIAIPPLRERREDIPTLVQHFMRKKYRELGLKGIPSLAPMALDALMSYQWPGNVRELENAVERAMILYDGRHLRFDDLGHPGADDRRPSLPTAPSGSFRLEDVMAAHIRKAMETAGGRVEGRGGAAELLGVKPGTLRHRMRKMGIPFGRTVEYSA
jgi:transcriptional regulator with GAF, ATPase, and Fis domain